MSARILAFMNSAGGSGRTTSALAMAVAFSEYGRRVLMVDCDPQGALSFILGKEGSRRGAYDIFSGRERALAMIHQTDERVDLIPASPKLAELSALRDEQVLSKALNAFEYDIIIIDTGSGTSALHRSVLTAADEIFIPTRLDLLSARGALAVADGISRYRARLRGILPTNVDIRSKHGHEVMRSLKDRFGDLVIEPGIPKSPLMLDSVVAGQSLLSFKKASEVAGRYREITYDFL